MSGSVLTIGNLPMDMSRSWFTIRRRGIRSQTNRLFKVRTWWDITGSVNADPGQTSPASMAQVDEKVVALEDVLVDGIDIHFSIGSTMNLISSQTTEGTHIEHFSWLPGFDGVRGSGAEGLLRRTFHLVIFGDEVVTDSGTDITSYHDSIRAIGSGGPKVVPATSLAGGVQAQQTIAATPFFAVQSGYATGLLGYPTAPLPLYTGVSGVFYFPDSLELLTETPREWGKNLNLNYPIRWSYRCWSANNLLGTPPVFQ